MALQLNGVRALSSSMSLVIRQAQLQAHILGSFFTRLVPTTLCVRQKHSEKELFVLLILSVESGLTLDENSVQ